MLKLGVIAFVPALFVSWLLQEPGPFRGAEAVGGAIPIIGAGLLAAYVATRQGSTAPNKWGAAAMACWALFMFLGGR
jgi:hypothetical protein